MAASRNKDQNWAQARIARLANNVGDKRWLCKWMDDDGSDDRKANGFNFISGSFTVYHELTHIFDRLAVIYL